MGSAAVNTGHVCKREVVTSLEGEDLTFSDWTRAIGTDSTSAIARSNQALCNSW